MLTSDFSTIVILYFATLPKYITVISVSLSDKLSSPDLSTE